MVPDGVDRPSARDRDRRAPVPYRFLLPGLPADLVRRERLVSRLDSGLSRHLTVVTAPAGSGKTTLVAAWARQASATVRVCWLTLQAEDADPEVFRTHVVDGLRRLGVAAAGEPAVPGDWSVVDALVASVADDEVVVLVLDDADVLTSAAGAAVVDAVRRNADHLRVAVLSRATPRLPLYRLRLADQLSETRAADLALTRAETARLLRSAGVELTAGQLDDLQQRTRGWAAGTRFAAMALAGRHDPGRAVEEFTGDTGDVAEYLLEEVLRRHSPQVRASLLRCSVVEQLCPGLVEALTGVPDAKHLMSFLARGNLFVQPVPDRRDRYVLQPLFRAFLRARLDLEHPGEATRLHLVAAQWLADHGQLLGSLRHARQAGAWETAARHLLDQGGLVRLVAGPDAGALAAACADMPEVGCGAAGDLVAAAAALTTGDTDRCDRRLRSARSRPSGGSGQRVRTDEAAGSVLRALLDERQGQWRSTLTSVAVALDACEAASVADRDLAALLHGARGRALLGLGRIEAARAALATANAHGDRGPTDTVLARGTATAALVEAVAGRLRRAEDLAGRAEALSGTGDLLPRDAAVAVAWVASERSDLVAAEAALRRVPAGAGEDPVTDALLELVRIRLLRARGDTDLANDRLRSLRQDAGPLAWLTTPPSADPVPAQGGGSHRLADRVTLLVTEAAHLLCATRTAEARDRVEIALRLAAPEQLREPFLDVVPGLSELFDLPLLRRHRWLRATPVPVPRSGGRATGGPERGGFRPTRLQEPLTGREHEVLQHLSELLTTEEMATEMFVSVNTVRTHVRGVLRKLSAGRRNEAVRRAWELGLLSPPTLRVGPSRTGQAR